MSTLIFNPDDVRRVAEHAVKADAAVYLVHDDGVYLMSAGEPPDLLDPHGTGRFVAYAKGMNPKLDPEWFDTARDAVGGDDFGEELPWARSLLAHANLGRPVTVAVSAKSIRLVQPEKKKGVTA